MENFTLQLFHVADQEAGVPALDDAPRFSAVLNALRAEDIDGDGVAGFANTLTLSSGDAIIPGLFFNASQQVFGGAGRADILIQNELGIQAIAFGNHEFDLGTALVKDLVGGNAAASFPGTSFPYLSSNLDFSTDANLAGLVVPDAQAPLPNSIAASTVIEVNGEKIGIVGATTPTIRNVNVSISSPGNVTVLPRPFDGNPTPEQLDALAAEIQADVDALLAANPDVDKVIGLFHMQQIAIERELAQRLTDVDIIVAGGSNTRLLDETDRLRAGDTIQGPYPIVETDAEGNPVAVVNTDGNYKYVGRLVIDFDASGNIIPASYDPAISGAFATDDQGVADLSAEGLIDPEIQDITNDLREVIVAQEGNFFGISNVFLNGARGSVRTEETNLGNLTADANLAIAREADPTVAVSIKNGGGIRDNIGRVVVPTGGTGEPVRLPTEAVTDADGNIVKPEGGLSQNDIINALRFNNGLTLVTVTAEELVALLEHGVSASAPGATPGQFPQVGGVQFSFDLTQPAGDRIESAALVDDAGNPISILVDDGEVVGNPDREIRVVTLNFLAGGGDGYRFDLFGEERVDLTQPETAPRTGAATFAPDGSEQDALAEYLAANFSAANPFNQPDVPPALDERLQNLAFREDTVLEGAPKPINLTVLGTFETGVFDEGAAEINAFDPISDRLFVVNGAVAGIDILDLSDPSNPTQIGQIDITPFGGGVNSVAVKNGVVAAAVEAEDGAANGQVVFFNASGDVLNAVSVGVLPDALTFTPDGTKVLVANEGEPVLDDDGNLIVDPQGSISIIDLSNGVADATVTTLDFTEFDSQVADLRADGVRIFPGRLPSADFEPELIAISPDGTKAFATLQENNAVAVVDLATKTIAGIQPLGVKDFSKGLPELTSFEISDRGDITNGSEALVTATGETIELGGFSGLFYDGVAENGNLKFLVIPDRGPNGDVTAGNRPFLLPDYQARIVSLELNETTGDVTITDELFLTRADGTPITGLPNIPGIDERAVDAAGNFVDLPFLEGFETYGTDYDPLGADMEGIVRAPDGTFWTVDEYRPAIYQFGEDGVLLNRFVPEGTVAQANAANPGADFAEGTFGTETLPAEYFKRRENRGFEGMALDTDNGILYAFIQTPLNNPNRATGNASSVIRMLGIDPATGTPVSEYVYLLQKPAIGNDVVDKIGDAAYAGDGKFVVMERDSSLQATAQKFVFEVDLTGATNVLGFDFGGETLEQQTADDLAALGITPVNKVKVTNLPSLGYLPSDKPEGLTVLEDGRLAVLNDNDFGLVPGAEGVELGIISFTGSNGLDASDRDGGINIDNEPVFGLFMPDAIATFEVDGRTFYITANEGDDRGDADADPLGDVVRLKDLGDVTSFGRDGLALDERFDPALLEDEELGRLVVSSIDGDLDGDNDLDQIFTYGGRSFTIFDELGNLVFDSGDALEQITAAAFPADFNADNAENDSFDNRSDNKGPEPEGVVVGEVDGTPFAFVGLERIGGIAVYNISNPSSPEFVQYVNNRDFSGDAEAGTAGDLGPEGLTFISEADSPVGVPLLVVSNEVSGTTTVYSLFDSVVATPSDDIVVGTEDDDIIFTQPGNDVAVGGAGNDTISVGDGEDVAAGQEDNDAIFGGNGDDVLRGDKNIRRSGTGVEGGDDVIFGGAGNDRIGGKAGNDDLHGDEGNDTIYGDDGDDTLTGGLGDDVLFGDDRDGAGSDLFVLAAGAGTDTINDFEVGTDFIGLAGGLSFAQLSLTQDGNNILIGLEDETLAVVRNVASLAAESFMSV